MTTKCKGIQGLKDCDNLLKYTRIFANRIRIIYNINNLDTSICDSCISEYIKYNKLSWYCYSCSKYKNIDKFDGRKNCVSIELIKNSNCLTCVKKIGNI